ncbi:MAG: tetratricopeptide repeat protein [Saprospiraceae bacterium]
MENRAEHLLESYFANTLTEAEATELKQLVSADPALATELAFQQRVATAVQSRSFADNIQNMTWRAAAQNNSSGAAMKVFINHRYFYAAAAALALLLVAYLFIMPPSLQSVVADNSKEYPNKMKFKSLGDESEQVPENVIQAFEFYDNKKYGEASKSLQIIAANNRERMDYRFYWGVSLVKDKQYSEAIAVLSPLVQAQGAWKVPALYYLGLACAGYGDKDCARQNLEAYIESSEGVSFRAQAIAVKNAL